MFKIENRRYIGSKRQLVNKIEKTIIKYNENYTSFADIFAGTGVVPSRMSNIFNEIILNDILYSNSCIYNAFFGTEYINKNKIESFVKSYGDLKDVEVIDTFFSKLYSDTYFDKMTTLRIGTIREKINEFNFNQREKDIMISSLIYSMDRCANTVGHYESFFRTKKNSRTFNFELIDYNRYQGVCEYKFYRSDANQLVKTIKADVFYLDPPYNSRQYSRFYHLLETLVKWVEFEPMGKALKPPLENLSEYSRKDAVLHFKNLIEDINAKLIIVSYNDTYNSTSNSSNNKILYDDIVKILSQKGTLTIDKVKHKHFNAGITKLNNNLEFLFVCKVYNV